MYFISLLLFGISANIDTLVLGFSYGLKKQQIPFSTNLLLSLITFAGTLLATGAGRFFSALIPSDSAKIAGSCLLLLLGAYYCLKHIMQYRTRKKQGSGFCATPLHVQCQSPSQCQSTSHLTRSETLVLGLTLTTNNAGMGIGASFAGLHFLWASVSTFFLSAAFLIAGNRLGTHFAFPKLQDYPDLISGLIILALGLYELF